MVYSEVSTKEMKSMTTVWRKMAITVLPGMSDPVNPVNIRSIMINKMSLM